MSLIRANKIYLHVAITFALLASICCVCTPVLAQQEKPAEPESKLQPISSPARTPQSLDLAAQSSLADQDSIDVALSATFMMPVEKHRWMKFPSGSWREISITTETASQPTASISRSVTTQVEKLQAKNLQQYTLAIQATVDVVGKQVVGPQITRVLHSSTDRMGQTLETRRLSDEDLMLTQGPVPCEVWEIVYEEDSQRQIDRIYYSAEKYPYVVQRHTMVESGDSGNPAPMDEVTTIVATDVPYVVGQETQLCTCLRTVQQGDKGSTVTIAMLSDSVPGGEVAVWSTDFDLQGVRSRWSTQKLVSYGTTPRVKKPLTRRELRRVRRSR